MVAVATPPSSANLPQPPSSSEFKYGPRTAPLPRLSDGRLVAGDVTGHGDPMNSLEYLSTWTSTYLNEQNKGCPTAEFTHSVEGRHAKWVHLRAIHKRVYEGTKQRIVSVENCLWEVAHKDGRVSCDLFCSSLIGAWAFDRKMRMEERLTKCYHCFEGSEVDLVDYREFIVCLRILENFNDIPKKARSLLMRFYDMWSTPTGSIPRSSCLKLVSVAAETEQEIYATRGLFDQAISDLAAHYGLKSTTTEVPRDLFLEVLEVVPSMIKSFQECMWKRGDDQMRLDYLSKQETLSEQRADYYDNKFKWAKADQLFGLNLRKWSFNQWCKFTRHYQRMKADRLYMMYRKTGLMTRWWAEWASDHKERSRRRRIAKVMGHMHILRNRFRTWARWTNNQLRVLYCTRKWSAAYKIAAQAMSFLRFAWTRGELRMALGQWHEEVVFQQNWDFAAEYHGLHITRLHFRSWKRLYADIMQREREELDARKNQLFIKELNEEIEAELEAERQRLEAERLAEIERKRAERAEIKRQKMYWNSQRIKANKQMDARYIHAIQEDERKKLADAKREKMWDDFEEKWKSKEIEMVAAARVKQEKWLKDKSVSAGRVKKEFLELRRRLQQPPRLEEAERERQINSLSNIVLIKIEAMLFKNGQLLEEVVTQFDADGNGFLSHEEFRDILKQLPDIALTNEQERDVIRDLDKDNDGFVSLAELDRQIEAVAKICGTPGSPWKLYVDPAQDVTCLENMHTGEKIFDFRMRDKRLKEITKENLVCEAVYNARVQAHKDREEDRVATLKEFSATIMQRMYRQWAGNKRMEEMRWKIIMHRKEKDRLAENAAALLLQAFWRGRTERLEMRSWIAQIYCKRYDDRRRKPFYENVYTYEKTWHRPYIHARLFPEREW